MTVVKYKIEKYNWYININRKKGKSLHKNTISVNIRYASLKWKKKFTRNPVKKKTENKRTRHQLGQTL